MGEELFREGGPLNIKRVGISDYQMTVTIPVEPDGRISRECPNDDCSPGLFKVKPGTGITDHQDVIYCPYCKSAHEPSDFTTESQIKFAKELALREAHNGVNRIIKDTLGFTVSNRRTLSKGGLLNISMELKTPPPATVHHPFSEIIRRDVICPKCGLDHSVFGLATWCSDCGSDIFTTHVFGEICVVKKMLGDVPRREELLGTRIARADVENALEDLVSVFEASMRHEVKMALKSHKLSSEDIDKHVTKIGNKLQSIRCAIDILPTECGVGFDSSLQTRLEWLDTLFQKRHPITHNLGVIDRKYLKRIQGAETEGKEVFVTREEVEKASDDVFEIIENYHRTLFPEAVCAKR